MSAVSLVLLGLCAVIVQSGVVIVARHFLDVHQERPLSAIGRMITLTCVIFTGLTFLSTILAPSPLQGLFSLLFLAFLALFIYLDAASRCLPRCFTLAFGLTGAVWRFILSPESGLTALLTALSVFGVLWGLRTLAYRRDDRAQFGLGDVYLMAGLGLWFSFPAVLWVISGAAIAGGLFLLARRSRHPIQWQENVNHRSAPFAPFLCGVAAIDHLWLMGSYVKEIIR
ncbi:prepilin peptidase [Symbiopectobacterium purcellii]|uniref:prepilin peptidase n=1 Tax=Symbiopectobacterium purcellii TaxID=2871826 RepID=UPI003F85CEEC